MVASRLRYEEHGGAKIATLAGSEPALQSEQDAVDLVGNVSFAGASGLLLEAGQLAPEFFDMKSGFAGAVLQKFINYRVKLAVLLPDETEFEGAFGAFVNESTERGNVNFLSDRGQAVEWLASG